MTTGTIQRESNHKFWKKAKHWAMKWIWRVQQIAMISTLFITAMTLTLQVSGKLDIGIENPYAKVLVTFMFLGIIILSLGYVWDVKGKFWVEQGEVVTERNPYMTRHMTVKEVVSNLTMWIPLYRATGIIGAQVMEDWCKMAIEIDPKIKPRCDELIREFGVEDFVKETYPWYEQEYLREKAKGE